MNEDARANGPLQWPRQWVRDESFWRDVATRTVAGLIVAFLVFLVGVGVGLIPTKLLAGVLILLASSSALVGAAMWLGRVGGAAIQKSVGARRVVLIALQVIVMVALLWANWLVWQQVVGWLSQ